MDNLKRDECQAKKDEQLKQIRDRTICLIGSIKQVAEWHYWADKFTEKGYIVLDAGCYHSNSDQERWDRVEAVHQIKILSSGYVAYMEKPDGTIGHDTQKEIEFASKNAINVYEVNRLDSALKPWSR